MHGKSMTEIEAARRQIKLVVSMVYDEKIEEIDQVHIPDDDIVKNMTGTQKRLFRLGRSIQMLGSADLVIFATDYSTAKGCRVEKFICEVYGIKYRSYDDIWKELRSDPFKWSQFKYNTNVQYGMTY